MNKYYKIKVGIEEYEVKEEDIPRIIEAMKTNNMVQLDCGLFRGQTILAVARDFEKEQIAFLSIEKTSEEELERRKKALEEAGRLAKQRAECTLCKKKGWVHVFKYGELMVRECECMRLKLLNN